MTALQFTGSLILIVAAAELFTNAIEWAGYRLKLGSGATGSLLAAIGTALPETVVPIIALMDGAPDAHDVAIGSILGSSFLLLTLGAGFTGLAVAVRRSNPRFHLDPSQVRRDLGTFIIAYIAVLVSIALPHPARIGVAMLLLVGYGVYVTLTLRSGTPTEDMPEPLHLQRFGRGHDPRGTAVLAQLALSVGTLIVGAQVFLAALQATATALAVPAMVVALVLVPAATELPETLNGVLWVRTNDDGLAFGNVAGSATFQACILGALGLAFTEWNPRGLSLLSGPLALLTAAFTLAVLYHGRGRGGMVALCIVPWVGYVILAVATGGALGGK